MNSMQLTNEELLKLLRTAAIDSVCGNLSLADKTLYWIAMDRIHQLLGN